MFRADRSGGVRKEPLPAYVRVCSVNLAADERLVFFHIPKTAGTSIHTLLSQHFKPAEICPFRFDDIRDQSESVLRKYRFFSGHYSKAGLDRIVGPKRVFTFLRDPRARVLSLYYFWKSHTWEAIEEDNLAGPRFAKQSDLLTFLSANPYPGNIDNAMVRALLGPASKMIRSGFCWEDSEFVVNTALANLLRFNHIGFQETFSEDVLALFAKLGVKADPSEVSGRRAMTGENREGDSRREPVEREALTDEINAQLDRLTALDQAVFDYCWANRGHIGCPWPM